MSRHWLHVAGWDVALFSPRKLGSSQRLLIITADAAMNSSIEHGVMHSVYPY